MFINGYPYTDFHELNADFLVKNYKLLLDSLRQIDSWIETHQKEYDELNKLVDQIEAGVLPDSVYANLKAWFVANYKDILGEFIKFISVSLTDDGYIMVSIPDGLHELVFNTTGLDIFTPLQPQYGHLTLSY